MKLVQASDAIHNDATLEQPIWFGDSSAVRWQ
jgi:hypothetical protein